MLEGAVRFKYIFESEIIVMPYKVHVNLNWGYTPMGVGFWEKIMAYHVVKILRNPLELVLIYVGVNCKCGIYVGVNCKCGCTFSSKSLLMLVFICVRCEGIGIVR